jgi:CMP/dCMP kinase
MAIRVVTVSREFGSGGRVFGRLLAERLGWDYLDSRLVDEVANRMRCPEELVQRWEERGEGIILRLLRALQASHPEAQAPDPIHPPFPPGDFLPERVTAMVAEVIREEGRRGHAVIVGRGAAWLLGPDPGCFHVRLVGDREDRIARIAERLSLGRDDATRLVDRTDRDRASYLKHEFGVDWRDPHHFHLVINTSRTPAETAVTLVEPHVRGSL